MLVIGITGTLGAGKGTVVDYLIKNKSFKHYSMSGFLKDELEKKNLEINRTNLQDIGNHLREKFGPDYITQKLFEKAKVENIDAIIESIRNPKEAEYIKSHGGFLIAVTANQKVRYKRIKSRGSEKDSVTFDEFIKQEKRELQSKDTNAQNLPECIKVSDYKITNNSTVKNLNKKIEKIIQKMKNEESKIEKYQRPSWDDYFMEVMDAIAKRATCDRGRAGTVIVKDKQILATGYVGSPVGFPHCDEAGHDLRKSFNEDGTISQHCVRTIHSEQNAICQAAKRGVSIEGSTVYTRMTPCRTCAMLLINCGVARIYCQRKYHTGTESDKMFKKAGIKIGYKYNELQKYSNQKG